MSAGLTQYYTSMLLLEQLLLSLFKAVLHNFASETDRHTGGKTDKVTQRIDSSPERSYLVAEAVGVCLAGDPAATAVVHHSPLQVRARIVAAAATSGSESKVGGFTDAAAAVGTL